MLLGFNQETRIGSQTKFQRGHQYFLVMVWEFTIVRSYVVKAILLNTNIPQMILVTLKLCKKEHILVSLLISDDNNLCKKKKFEWIVNRILFTQYTGRL